MALLELPSTLRMGPSPHRLQSELSEHSAAHHAPPVKIPAGKLKVISWNLLRLVGARVEDVAALIERQRPDLLLMQEATEELGRLPSLVGGHFYREPMHARVYGLAAWSPHPFAPPRALALPVSIYFIKTFYSSFQKTPGYPVYLYGLCLAGIAALALVTVFAHCQRAAARHPIHTLRFE